MGQKILGIDWQADFGEVFGGPDDLVQMTLVRIERGTPTPSDLAAGSNPTSTSYPCRGYEASWSQREMASISLANGDRIKVTDRKIVILGSSLGGGAVVPQAGDRMIVGSKHYNVVPVDGDSSGASYTLVGRK